MKACLHLLISWLVCIALAAIGFSARAEMSPTDPLTSIAQGVDDEDDRPRLEVRTIVGSIAGAATVYVVFRVLPLFLIGRGAYAGIKAMANPPSSARLTR